MDYNLLISELKAAMYPTNRYLQSKICVRLDALAKNKNKNVSERAGILLQRANALKEPYNFDKKLERPENIPQLMEVYKETIFLISDELV